jgi:hypothetical protein
MGNIPRWRISFTYEIPTTHAIPDKSSEMISLWVDSTEMEELLIQEIYGNEEHRDETSVECCAMHNFSMYNVISLVDSGQLSMQNTAEGNVAQDEALKPTQNVHTANTAERNVAQDEALKPAEIVDFAGYLTPTEQFIINGRKILTQAGLHMSSALPVNIQVMPDANKPLSKAALKKQYEELCSQINAYHVAGSPSTVRTPIFDTGCTDHLFSAKCDPYMTNISKSPLCVPISHGQRV